MITFCAIRPYEKPYAVKKENLQDALLTLLDYDLNWGGNVIDVDVEGGLTTIATSHRVPFTSTIETVTYEGPSDEMDALAHFVATYVKVQATARSLRTGHEQRAKLAAVTSRPVVMIRQVAANQLSTTATMMLILGVAPDSEQAKRFLGLRFEDQCAVLALFYEGVSTEEALALAP